MSKYLVLGLLVAGIAVGTYVGCGGARVGVAKDAAIKKIDDLLGPLNVKQKEVEMAFAELEKSSEGVKYKRYDAQSRLKQLNEKQVANTKDKTELLGRLKELSVALSNVNSEGMFEREGKASISATQLQSVADDTMSTINSLNEKISNSNAVIKVWEKNFELLKNSDDASSAQLKKFKSQLTLIQGKKSTLDALKEATVLGAPGESISDKFSDLTDSVEDLMREVDTGLAFEEAKIDDRIAEVEQGSMATLEDLLGDGSTAVSETISAMDKMLKEAGK
ncbi:MAG: putative nucleic acid-binding Zn-ribbon protein [Mariniblastus sp.]|jgi:predicted  nucleic acid-binding Zn-ribbon protein